MANQPHIHNAGKVLKTVSNYKYLGSIVSANATIDDAVLGKLK